MTNASDDRIGAVLDDLDTPALLLDLAASDRNLRTLADYFRGRPCRLRPHFKNHKCLTLARRQMAAGSIVGMTCAKLGEAEVLADGGVHDVLIANQVVGRRKLARLVRLAERIDIKVAVDQLDHVEPLSQAAAAAGVTVGVLIEVDIGMGRCGVSPGPAALELARAILQLPGLRFDGIQAYEGHAVYVDDPLERSRRVRESMEQAVQTRRLLETHGIDVRLLSGGSSSTYEITGNIDGVDEIQAGSYATLDWRYQQLVPQFDIALSVLARVISKRPAAAVLDVGLKGAGSEFGLPRIKGQPEAEIRSFVSEEHCVVFNTAGWQVGQVVELLPSHACTTCNLYRELHVHEAGRIVAIWPIEGAGKLT